MNDHLPKTRAEAQAARSAKYFTGTPCKRGHLAPRYVDNSVCMTCRAEDVRVKRQADRAARREGSDAHVPRPQLLRPEAPQKLRLRKVEVTAAVTDIDTVDAFNEARLRARFPDDPGKRIGPMPRLLPKGRIRLFAHPDDVSTVTTYANLLRTAK